MPAAPMLLTASWIFPFDGPPLRDASVLIENSRIAAIGPTAAVMAARPEAARVDLTGHTLLPGLVNAHVHLELSNHRPGSLPASFVDWLVGLMSHPLDVTQAVRAGVVQCLRFGVTTVGDISRQSAITRPMLATGPLRVVSYGEVQAMAQRRYLLEERLAVAADQSRESQFLRVGITPHAPYSIEADGYRRCLELASHRGLPLATHLAETVDERSFLATHDGPFLRLWNLLQAWDDKVPRFEGGPIRYAQSLGLLDYPALLAHVNYCDDEEIALLARGKASVVYCPRTHAYFGHPPHRWQAMLASGINVGVGTDSCASSPDLNLLDDLRLIHRLAPEVKPQTLFEMATVRAARAIGMNDTVGSLTPGKWADVLAFPVAGDLPLRELLEIELTPQVWVGGVKI